LKYFSIRQFEERDIDFAYKLDVIEQWNDTRDDIKRMSNYDPDGCFVTEVNSELVGHVFSISYGKLGWIGLLIVKAKYRRKGVGALLTKKAIEYLLNCGVKTIKLEAVSTIANLYRKLGFVNEFDSLRFAGTGGEKDMSPSSRIVNHLKKEEVTELARFDAEYFGANRIKVLMRLYHDNPKLCYASHAKSKITGYIMCRKAETGYKIGPWVCNPEHLKAARELLMKCIETIGRNERLYVGAPAVNEKAVEILHDLNFKQYPKSIRMYLGKKLETERADGIFAIGGPEKG
jgi:ribosomal protein S18 acetylase RimI-like enzyme